jgi:hypothetical protein
MEKKGQRKDDFMDACTAAVGPTDLMTGGI